MLIAKSRNIYHLLRFNQNLIDDFYSNNSSKPLNKDSTDLYTCITKKIEFILKLKLKTHINNQN